MDVSHDDIHGRQSVSPQIVGFGLLYPLDLAEDTKIDRFINTNAILGHISVTIIFIIIVHVM